MYYEEEIINGILHYRLKQDGEWAEVSKEQLSSRAKAAEKKIRELKELIKKMTDVVS